MALPQPLPDNPNRWEGWRRYNSANLYERLCLDFDPAPTADQIEENCRTLLVWWQKKLPLKNQPSNPLTQLLRVGMDEAPVYIAEARTKLLDPAARGEIDAELRAQVVRTAGDEFKKLIEFAVVAKTLTPESEARLYESGGRLGLLQGEMRDLVDGELTRIGGARIESSAVESVASRVEVAAPGGGNAMEVPGGTPAAQFEHLLRLSKLSLDGDEMTDDQRDALCNMGESLGLTGGQAEDLIDAYLEEVSNLPLAQPIAPRPSRPPFQNAASRPAPPAPRMSQVPFAGAAGRPSSNAASTAVASPPVVTVTPLGRINERAKHPNFTNSIGAEMLLIPTGVFNMGSAAREAAAHEQPVVPTTVSCFYLGRFPVTNAQYEKCDPEHRQKRAPWANELHPVVFVSSRDAAAFCAWLSHREGRKYRLPTEAEWEYAARSSDDRVYPWGERLDAGHFANFADRSTNFPWRDLHINDGFPETAPVGSFPRGASPFGPEDLAGNVFEWCSDYFDFYRTGARVNPKGPKTGQKRVYRGGSWKSRATSLRSSARAFNIPEYSSNDLGFRVVCECV